MPVNHQIQESHPWTGKRWFMDILYRETLLDWPNADKDYVFAGCKIKCEEAWNVMSDKQKQRFNRYAEIDQIQCRSAKSPIVSETIETTKAIKAIKPTETTKKKQQVNSKPKQVKKKSDTDKPQKLSGYQLFVKANRKKLAEANPDFTGQELMKEIGHMWTNATEKEKKTFVERANKENEQKLKEFKAKLSL